MGNWQSEITQVQFTNIKDLQLQLHHKEVKMAKKVRGFSKNAAAIAKRQGISKERASAILAAATRRASKAAKRKNPRLKRVRG